ncbi:hypothetical protein OCU04_001449 [Sclerotinia nivalis]|uniref:Uncharacterized protein n=1 Tax=Sclerotinia nivalis TaxID=352851 RepID=A0A9X0AZ88_9HELO|nr:hypothetical protein OCU04_001449 [Sclerotinia nivalis]
MEIEEFYCDADWEEGSLESSTPEKLAKFVYIHRLGEYVRFAIVGTNSDGEISYRIGNDGKWEIKSAQHCRSSTYNDYWVIRLPRHLGVCEDIEKDMARDMAKRFLVKGALKDIRFPVRNFIPQAKIMKEKSNGRRSNRVKDVRLKSSGGSSRVKSSDTLMDEDSNVKLTEREAQVSMLQNSVQERAGPLRKRQRED